VCPVEGLDLGWVVGVWGGCRTANLRTVDGRRRSALCAVFCGVSAAAALTLYHHHHQPCTPAAAACGAARGVGFRHTLASSQRMCWH
jgi:hypothetical protein